MRFVLTHFGQVFSLELGAMQNFMDLKDTQTGKILHIPVADEGVVILTDALAAAPDKPRDDGFDVVEEMLQLEAERVVERRMLHPEPEEPEDEGDFLGTGFVPR